MEELRVARRRTGASRWGLFEDAERPGHFIDCRIDGEHAGAGCEVSTVC
jgi:hypothetical protein